MAPRLRALLAFLLALGYGLATLWLAGTSDLLKPLGWGTMIVAPVAIGFLLALGFASPPRLVVALGAPLTMMVAGAVAITVGWLPLGWFAVAGPWLAAGAIGGGVIAPLVPEPRIRALLTVLVAAAPAIAGTIESARESSPAEVTVTSLMEIRAPAAEAWEEVIGSDSAQPARAESTIVRAQYPDVVAISMDEPKPLALRHLVFSDGSRIDERVIQWEDGEWLRAHAGPRVIPVPRGVAAWTAGSGAAGVTMTDATYELVSDDDSTTTLHLTTTYRLAIHGRAYPPGWLARVAQAKNDRLAAAIRARSEARVASDEPRLTAEMWMLRRQLVADFMNIPRPILSAPGTLPVFVDGERAIQVVDEELARPATLEAGAAELRTALTGSASRARTTGWYLPVIPEATRNERFAANTVLFEYEDYLGRCVAELVTVTYGRSGEPTLHAPVGQPSRARCEPIVMAERARRSRLLAQLALSAGDENDNWSVALLARGVARVYADSVVIRADTLRLRVNTKDGTPATIDSVVVGLSSKTEQSWYMGIRGTNLPIQTTLKNRQTLVRPRARFVVPVDSAVDLTKVWPTFEVDLVAPKTPENPDGRAWTYSHAPMAFFGGVKR